MTPLQSNGAAVPDPFTSLDPEDGYRVELVSLPSEISLHASARHHGERVDLPIPSAESSFELCKWLANDCNAGAAVRLSLFLDALARYLSTGGSWEELFDALPRAKLVFPGGLVFDGYYYHDGYLTDTGVYEHVYAKTNGSGAAVVWQEGPHGFIDFTTLQRLEQQQANWSVD